MKKIITTLAMVLMLGTQLHAETTQKSDEKNEFSLRYKVNLARLISTYDNNDQALVKLREFMDNVMNDKERQITQISIWGYASPDGSSSLNERLSAQRADDCCDYLRERYSMLDDVECKTKGVAQQWIATKGAIEESNIPMKSEVLTAITSDMSQSQIEQKLKNMPSAWGYFCKSVLPPMRCVEILISQKSTPKPTAACPPAPKCTPKPPVEEVVVVNNNYYVITKREPSRLLAVENQDYAPLDFPCAMDRAKVKGSRQKAKIKDRLKRQKYLWRSW